MLLWSSVDLVKQTHPDTPFILYISGSAGVLERMGRTGVDIISLDWTVDLGIEHLDCRLSPFDDPCSTDGEQRAFSNPRDWPDHAGGIGGLNGLSHPLVPAS